MEKRKILTRRENGNRAELEVVNPNDQAYMNAICKEYVQLREHLSNLASECLANHVPVK